MNTLRRFPQNIDSIILSCKSKLLFINTLSRCSQGIHSIILRGKVLRTKELWETQAWSRLLTGFQRPRPSRPRAAFAAPESGSGPLSLIFGRDSGGEENAPRKTKVTPIPGIARLGASFQPDFG